eukprot:CAMPEP_0185030360 /NCGR_PEP_ID=MMETSP1103-20130426/17289_1 /TAXON_ID=36769 /ORGANISM="Paraphysomonas bandaiensis, Strain Caron Lab Isolate" /LENGTH=60 /DNA_ID=CAMNT_0027565459 /DNA_START=233 /DNA_END=415 /DNA_ORIENTATION=-
MDALSDISPTLLGFMNVIAFMRTNKKIKEELYSWIPDTSTVKKAICCESGVNYEVDNVAI